jgi:hypothetical protein
MTDLQRGSDRHRDRDQRHPPRSPLHSGSHLHASNLPKNRIRVAGFGRLAHQEVEKRGQHDRGDNGEEDHQQAPWPAAQWPYL